MRLYIEVYEAPVLQESMQTNDAANIAWKILATNCCRKIGIGVFSVKFDYVVSMVKVSSWIFMRELSTEEFRQTLRLYLMNSINIEPSRAARYYKSGLCILLLHY